MKALRLHEFGDPATISLNDVPTPEFEGFGYLIEVLAAGVNPVDWKESSAEGFVKRSQLPFILGWDVAGIVAQIGPDAGGGLAVGDEVYGLPGIRGGGFAEYIALQPTEVAKKPTSVDMNAAAGLPLVALTAWQALFDHGKLKQGERVLIHAAAGGVGSLAVQFAKNAGAYVIATGSESNESYINGLGADMFIDYQKTRFEDETNELDLVIDTLAGETQERSFSILKRGGRLVSTLASPNQERASSAGITGTGFAARPDAKQLKQIAALIDSRKIKVSPPKTLPIADFAKAFQESKGGRVRGKIVLSLQ